MTALLLILSGLVSLLAITNAQSYIPRPLVKSSCTSGTFVSIGNNNVTASDSVTLTTVGMIYTTMFNNTAPTTTINQLSFGIADNYQITSVALIRLALYQVSGTALTLVGQTSEIMLYATAATTLYADLITPAVIQRGTFAIAIWSNSALYTGINAVPAGMPANAVSTAYTSNGFQNAITVGNIFGARPVQMVGCSTGEDPFNGPTISYYSFCLAAQYTTPAVATSGGSATVAVTFNGVVAVNTATGGAGWYPVTGGNARYQTVTYGATSTSFSAATTQVARILTTTGGSFIRSYNQRLYTTGALGVDYNGISFQLPDGTQYILQYQNGTHEVMIVSPGSSITMQMDISQFTSASVPNLDVALPTCAVTPPRYTEQTFSCPAGQIPIKYGDDEDYDAILTVNASTTLVNANYLFMRPFTANIPGTTLYQLTWLINTNPVNRIGRIRLGLFTNTGSIYTLVEQTQEIKLWGTPSTTLLKANLIRPVVLTLDRNYSIAVVSDSPVYTSYATYQTARILSTSTYQQVASSARGFRTSVSIPGTLSTTLPVAASGCATQTITKYSFCAAYAYASYNQVYSGVLSAGQQQTDSKGTFRPVIEGFGTYNYTYTSSTLAPKIFRFTLHDYNLDGDNQLYTAGNLGSPVNEFGLQFVVQQGPSAGFAAQLKVTYDPWSETWSHKESTQAYSTTTVVFLNPIISTFTIAPYTDGQPIPSCVVPPKPANIISPLSVARAQCPNLVNDMADVFGDTDVGNYNEYIDETVIQGNRVYTQQFVADSDATVNQLAVGILQNANRPDPIQVRLGFYARANNSLLAQTAVLTINQAVPQLIILNLPFPVFVASGQTYLIAILTSAPLEVAHTTASVSPSMLVTFSATGLPATFVSGGNDVSPSIAAYACVRATHSFCANFQYYTPERESVTYLYQGLIQTGPTSATTAWGTYLPIWAAAGRLVSYRRPGNSATQVSTLFTFWQRPGTDANLYISPINGRALDATGIIVQTSIGADSNLQYNLSINKFDESFAFSSTLVESDLRFSNFTFTPLGAQYGIPSCGISSLPIMQQEVVPLPVCEDGEEVVTYGTGDQFTLSANAQGVNGLPGGQIFVRQITTDGAKWSIITQLKFGFNVNFNTINTLRMGVYDSRMQFLEGTDDIDTYNSYDYIATGMLKDPLYLAPATVYYLALWTQNFIYAGFTSGSGPSMIAPLENGIYEWPQQFVDTNPNSQRAIGGFGCTTSRTPTTPSSSSSSSSSTGNPFVTSSSSRSSSSSTVRSSSSSSVVSSSTSVPVSSTASVTSSSSTQSSTSSFVPTVESSSTKSGLESGAIAGIVIGCVIASNLVLLCCMWLCCMGGMAAGKSTNHKHLEESRVGSVGDTNDHEIEMEGAA